MARLVWSALAASLACCACGGEPEPAERLDPPAASLLREPLAELPLEFSEVGLYPDLPDLSRVSRAALAYEPAYPLWSDGGEKARFLVLPEASTIDGSARDAYVFPLGTLLFKTFSYRTPDSPDRAIPVETRVLRLAAEGWEYGAYGWDAAGERAELLELKRGEARLILAEDGSEVEHRIPSRLECRQCHESAPDEVLGVNELQLAAAGELERLAPRIEPAPRAPFADLGEHGPLTRAALGHFVGNCTHCHNGGSGANSSFDLRPEVALTHLVGVPTASSATADGIRVEPGAPEQSILYLALSGTGDSEVKLMPPLGSTLRDELSLRVVYDWIVALGPEEDP